MEERLPQKNEKLKKREVIWVQILRTLYEFPASWYMFRDPDVNENVW